MWFTSHFPHFKFSVALLLFVTMAISSGVKPSIVFLKVTFLLKIMSCISKQTDDKLLKWRQVHPNLVETLQNYDWILLFLYSYAMEAPLSSNNLTACSLFSLTAKCIAV